MLRAKRVHLITGALALLAAVVIVMWFSETNRFVRFTEEVGVDRGNDFENDFVSNEYLVEFIRTRGYDDPFAYFEEGLGLRPEVVRLSDPDLSPNDQVFIASKDAEELTVYNITRGFVVFEIERRILIFHNGKEIKNMSSRTFETTF